MMRTRFLMKSAAAFALLGTTLGSTANATATRSQAVDPMVAVSLFGSVQSTNAAVAGQGAVSPHVVPASAAASASAAQDSSGDYYGNNGRIGILPVIVGLVAIAVVAALVLKDDDDGTIVLPISP